MLIEQTYSRPGALPKEPTDAPPGSEQKIRVMIERAARREQLFHPLDGLGCRAGLRPEERRWPLPICEPVDPELLTLVAEEAADDDEALPVAGASQDHSDASSLSFSA
jgi:hypothetical protein